MTATSPVIKAWELGIRLREYRQQAGLTATETAKRIGVTQGHVSAVEAGRPKLTADRLVQLGKLYDIGPEERTELESLRQGANEKAWWHDYSGIFSPELLKFFGLEAGAESVQGYQNEVFYGLLQTEDYARAIVQGGYPYTRLTEVEQRVRARLRRQDRLSGTDALRVDVLLGQGSLCLEVGGRNVMRRQLEHLARMSRQANISIRVVPFSAGAHPAIGAPFQILSFQSPRLHDLVWQEIVTSTGIVESQSIVNEYSITFHETAKLALSESASRAVIEDAAKEFA